MINTPQRIPIKSHIPKKRGNLRVPKYFTCLNLNISDKEANWEPAPSSITLFCLGPMESPSMYSILLVKQIWVLVLCYSIFEKKSGGSPCLHKILCTSLKSLQSLALIYLSGLIVHSHFCKFVTKTHFPLSHLHTGVQAISSVLNILLPATIPPSD